MSIFFQDEKVAIEEHPVFYARKEFWIGILAIIAGIIYDFISIYYFPQMNLKFEQIIYIHSLSIINTMPAVPLVFSIIGIIEIIVAELLSKEEKIIVTNKRVITVKGLVNKDISSAIPSKITDVKIDKTLADMLLRVSTIRIFVQDLPNGLEFHSIKNASNVQSKILDLIQGKLEIPEEKQK